MNEYKCDKCGWFHATILPAEANAQVLVAIEYQLSRKTPAIASIEEYLKCVCCSVPSTGFVSAEKGNASPLLTIQDIVIAGAVP